MYSFRIRTENSRFTNIKTSYSQFNLFAGVIAVFHVFGNDALITIISICVAYIRNMFLELLLCILIESALKILDLAI